MKKGVKNGFKEIGEKMVSKKNVVVEVRIEASVRLTPSEVLTAGSFFGIHL